MADKVKYEAPVLVDLGELARGQGKNCNAGSAANGVCKSGARPNKLTSCRSGAGKN
jgi:hypothetical protein